MRGGNFIAGKGYDASWSFRHGAWKSEPRQDFGSDAIGHNVPQNFDGIKQPQLRGFDDGHNQRYAFLAVSDHIPERNFSKKDTRANPKFSPIIRWGDCPRIFKKYEKFVLEFYQPLADIVGFVARQRLVLVQFLEPVKNVFFAGTLFIGS